MPKSREQRLFGAACLRCTVDDDDGAGHEIYKGALEDLELTDTEVRAYLAENEAEIRAALAEHSSPQA